MTKAETSTFASATPVLPSLNIERTVAFYCETFGFDKVHAAPREYAIVEHGPVELHFWFTDDPALAKASGCRIQVKDIGALCSLCQAAGIIHPNAALAEKPWGTLEFAVLDPDGNCLTFYENSDV